MAFSLSTTTTSQAFLCASFQPTSTTISKQHPPLKTSSSSSTLSFPFNFHSKSSILSPLSVTHRLCNHGGGHSFKTFVSAQDQPLPSMEEEKDDSQDVGESVETLTRFYKEAILAGDYPTIAEIETSFYRLEAEKNEMASKFSAMSEEITVGKERYIRLQADFDNFRKRSEKERSSVRSDAQGEVIESLLPMVDNFERAKQQLKPETDREKQIDTSYQGIYKQFVEIMRSLRVSVVGTVGKPFDPALHEAIAREESEEYKEGIISQEFRRGFILGDRLLRPAMVKVSSGSSKKTATPNSTKQPIVTPSSVEQPATEASIDEH